MNGISRVGRRVFSALANCLAPRKKLPHLGFVGNRLCLEALEDRSLLSATSLASSATNGVRFTSPIGPHLANIVPVPQIAVTNASSSPSSPSGWSPASIRQAYGFNNISFGNGVQGDGSGQTIAIVDAYSEPNIVSDLAAFDAQFGIKAPPSFTVVNQSGGSTLPPANVGWGEEECLDVEWAHAIAPGAKILLVEAQTDLFGAISYAASQPDVSVVSISWGIGGEFSNEKNLDFHFTTPAGHNGVTFVVSSGDSGSSAPDPDYPSVSPNVLTVGGTVLTADSQGNWQSETAWSGSGGGASSYEATPQFQQAVSTEAHRTIPDVSYNAVNYAVYDTYGDSGWIVEYGTSAGAPQWAALLAIANQGRTLAGVGTLDGVSQTLPMLYAMPSKDLHDITSGNNGGYSASTGYDLVTGIGTPRAAAVVSYLQPAWQQVDLSGSYNRIGITNDGQAVAGAGLDEAGHVYSANQLGASVAFEDTLIHFGPAGSNDVVSAQGQTISLPSGSYTAINILATAVNSDQTGATFSVTTDGSTQYLAPTISTWTSGPQYSNERRSEQMDYYDNTDGTRVNSPAYTYTYALAIDPSLTPQSLTLPNDPNIEILAIELYHSTQTPTQVDLSGSYNRVGFVNDGQAVTGSGIDGNGNVYSANQLGSSVAFENTSIQFGPAGKKNVVSAAGQVIALPADHFSTLNIIAAAVNGAELAQTFTVTYADYGIQQLTQSLSPWTAMAPFPNERRSEQMDYYDTINGTKVSTSAYTYAYSLAIDPTLAVRTLTLPRDSNVVVLAIVLS